MYAAVSPKPLEPASSGALPISVSLAAGPACQAAPGSTPNRVWSRRRDRDEVINQALLPGHLSAASLLLAVLPRHLDG